MVEVYDGDTITVDLDLGFGIWLRDQKIRLFGINAPEVRGESRERGLVVRDWVREQILGEAIQLVTIGNDKKGKYGRWLGIVLYGADNCNLGTQMLEKDMAVRYE